MHTVTVTGPGRDRGREYGRVEKHDILAVAAALKSHLARTGHPPGPLSRRLETSGLIAAAERHTPDVWAEVAALATSSGAGIGDTLLLTFLDEAWGLTRGCSTVARTIPGHRTDAGAVPPSTEIAQTMDLPAWADDRPLVLRLATLETPTVLALAYPGSIGLCGANQAGVGVAVNALPQFDVDTDGLGVAFIVRHLLTLTSLADCQEFLESVPHAAGQAYTIAAVDGIAAFEASAEGVAKVSAPDATSIVHTNHPLEGIGPSSTSSRERLAAVSRSIDAGCALTDALIPDAVLDGARLGDSNVTFGAFRAIGSEGVVRFISGSDLRKGRHEWSRMAFG